MLSYRYALYFLNDIPWTYFLISTSLSLFKIIVFIVWTSIIHLSTYTISIFDIINNAEINTCVHTS